MTGPDESAAVATALPDLSAYGLADLHRLDLTADEVLITAQVERPRVNLGGSAPPGRAD